MKQVAYRECAAHVSRFRKAGLLHFSSPIQKLNKISNDFGCNIFVKRDDLLGVGLGGNKIRKLEYLLGDALEKHCQLVVTSGSLQTNHGMLTAISASMLGMRCLLFLLVEDSGIHSQLMGNLLLDDYIGCDVEFLNVADIMENPTFTVKEKDLLVEERLAECRERKLRQYLKEHHFSPTEVYTIFSAGSMPLGVLGYVDCAKEIFEQLKPCPDYIFCGNGSGGTFAGLWLGSKLYMPQTKVIGINIEEMSVDKPGFIVEMIKAASDLLSSSVEVSAKDLTLLNNSLGEGYAVPDNETMETIEYVAKNEGFFLDPVYTGKIFCGALKHMREDPDFIDKNVLLLHSGGIPGIFNEEMVSYRTKDTKLLGRL